MATIAVTLGALVLAGTNTAVAFAGPGTGAAAFSGLAPTVALEKVVAPAAGTLVLSGQTLTASSNRVVTPAAGSISLAGQAPTLALSGATYYVSLSGSDANPGTLASPKRYISSGVALLAAGGTLYIRAGTYTHDLDCIDSNLYTVPSGSAGSLVTIAAYPGEDVTIRPANDVQIVRFQTGAPHHIEIRDIIFDGVNNTKSALIYQAGGAHHIRYFQNEIVRAYYFAVLNANTGTDFTGFNEWVDNEIHDTGDPLDPAIARGHALYISTADNLIAGNYLHDNSGYGIHCDDNALGTPPGVGPAYDLARNVIRNNRIYNNGLTKSTAFAINIARGDDCLVYNNKIYGNNSGIQCYSYSRGLGVYHNTIVGNTNDGIACQYYAAAGVTVRNNIAWSNGGNDFIDYGDIVAATTAIDDHNLTGTNPLFVNEATHDYHLTPTSPARDTGATVAAVLVDFDGVTRPQGAAVDIGAFELSALVIAPAAGTISLSSQTPSLAFTGTGGYAPAVRALVLAGTNTSIAFTGAATGTASFTGLAPNIGISGTGARTPAVGTLTFTGQAVTLGLTGSNITKSPAVGALAWEGSYSEVDFKGPDEGALTFTGLAPTVALGGSKVMLPALKALALTGQAVTILTPYRNPAAVSIAFTGLVPTVGYGLAPALGSLTVTGSVVNLLRGPNTFDVPQGVLGLVGQSIGLLIQGQNLHNPAVGPLVFTGPLPVLSFTVAETTVTIELKGQLGDEVTLKGRWGRTITVRGQV